MSTSSAPASSALATSASFTSRLARPEGNAVATEGTSTPVPATARFATATRSGYTHTAATLGQLGSPGSGCTALALIARTFPGVSAPSSVVRSVIATIVSSAQRLASFLIERVARPAARASAPTWSTPGRPCRNRRSVESDAVAAARSLIPSGATNGATADELTRSSCHDASMQTTVVDHPLAQQLLTRLRDERTDRATFRQTTDTLSQLIVYEASRSLAGEEVPITTPMGPATGVRIAQPPLVVPVLRAGLGMLGAVLHLM